MYSFLRSCRVAGAIGSSRPRFGWECLGVLVVAAVLRGGASQAASPARGMLAMVDRTVTQDQGAWVIDYRLRHTGQTGVIVTPEEIGVKVEGWVSNSRVASHAVPRWSSLAVPRGPELSAVSRSDRRGRRGAPMPRATAGFRPDRRPRAVQVPARAIGVGGEPARPRPRARVSRRPSCRSAWLQGPSSGSGSGSSISTSSTAIYDPLLAVRTVELTLGGSAVRDLVSLDREQYLAQPKFAWPEPPEERRDTRHAVSGPDSLHLEAHVPGHQYYRYPDRPVRYSTKMRLRFWYLIAAGTEGECGVRVTQYKDTPTSWRKLEGGGFEQCLKTVGRWTKVERIFQTEAEATTLALEFQIVGETDVGEMWIDDVSLEPVNGTIPVGP